MADEREDRAPKRTRLEGQPAVQIGRLTSEQAGQGQDRQQSENPQNIPSMVQHPVPTATPGIPFTFGEL